VRRGPASEAWRTGAEIGRGDRASPIGSLGYATVPGSDAHDAAPIHEQAAAIDSFCEQRDWELLELVQDVEDRNGRALDRPGLTYVLERLATGDASCLVVSHLNRLSHSASDLGRTLEAIVSTDGRLVAVDVGVDTGLPAGRKAVGLLISVGAWQREEIGKRTRQGLEAARAKGHQIGRCGVNHFPELKRRIVAMRADGMTLDAIADRLNAEGVPTLRGGEKWRPSSVQAATGYTRPRQRKERTTSPDELWGGNVLEEPTAS
jgi:DNA invertase Pin-like site-specific DNA recombinase